MSLRALNPGVMTRLVVAALAALLLAVTAAPAASAAEPSSQAAASLADALGIPVQDANRRLADQDRLSAVSERLTGTLGARAAGTWIDPATGALRVGVLDTAGADQVRAEGAEPVWVAHSLARLEQAQAALDAVGGAPGLSWGVDVPTNSLVITVPDGAGGPAADATIATARSLGVPVGVETAAAPPALQDFNGGEAILRSGGGRCSAGFNTVSGSGGQFVVTAGHCTDGFPTWSGDGQNIGPTAASSFPGNDYGAIGISNPAALQPTGGVLNNGDFLDISSAGRVPVNGSVCKTGSTTGTTCGTVRRYNVTVNYAGSTVRQLTETNVCVQPGDSGGPLFAGSQGQGVVSGGSIAVCSAVGFRSFFQPLDEILSAYGLRLS